MRDIKEVICEALREQPIRARLLRVRVGEYGFDEKTIRENIANMIADGKIRLTRGLKLKYVGGK